MPPENKTTQLESAMTSLPRTEGKDATSTIKEAWLKVKPVEDYLIRGIIAFLPRIEKEDVKPTFEHPENWNQLNLQEKANLIILDNIIKLICIADPVVTTLRRFRTFIPAPRLALRKQREGIIQAKRWNSYAQKHYKKKKAMVI